MSDYLRSSADVEPQLLLDSGPMKIRDFNPKGVLRFDGRKCVTCQTNIMDHWLRQGSGLYWCYADRDIASDGIEDAKWDVPKDFGSKEAD